MVVSIQPSAFLLFVVVVAASFSDLPQPIEWPDLQICKAPIVKDLDMYKAFLEKSHKMSFQNETEFESMAEQIFYTKVNEIITAIGIGPPQNLTEVF